MEENKHFQLRTLIVQIILNLFEVCLLDVFPVTNIFLRKGIALKIKSRLC